MLELDSVTVKNFFSYGDSETELRFDGLDSCLVIGSNGSGKSTLVNAIPWCIFGRTMHAAKPGDNVMNWFTGEPCTVTIRLKNGDIITRTRTKGNSELVVSGQHESLFSTASTTDNQQAILAKAYGLDWDIFCGSVFFSQVGRPWMDMTDQQRKKIIERLLHIDRFSCYADVAKEKNTLIASEQRSVLERNEFLKQEIQTIQRDIEISKSELESFEDIRQQRIINNKKKIENCKQELNNQPNINIEKLRSAWAIVEQIDSIRRKYEDNLSKLRISLGNHKYSAREVNAKIDGWNYKKGTICASCEQEINTKHISSKIGDLVNMKAKWQKEIEKTEQEIANIGAKVQEIKIELDKRKPKHSIREGEAVIQYRQNLKKQIEGLKQDITRIEQENNPHTASIERMTTRLKKAKKELGTLKDTVDQFDYLQRHYNYIHRFYSDRRRAKSYAVNRFLPFFNGRFRYYLDQFEIDLKLELTDSLAIKSDKWGHDYFSGGEKGSADLAFMFAMFDLHEDLYGRQCNVIVLDEVDSHLDESKVHNFIGVVETDLAEKAECVLVITHRNLMKDLFPHQITVSRDKDRISSIVESR